MNKQRWNERYEAMNHDEPGPASPILRRLVEGSTDGLPGGAAPVPTPLEPGAALDLAAGTGRNSIYLARRGWEVTAVDFSDVAVERGRALSERLGLSVTWRTEDLTAYRPLEAAFDLVCVFYLHLPWDTFSKILKHAAGAVKEKGFLLVVGHDLRNLDEGSGGPQNSEVLYTPTQVAEEVEPLLRVIYAESESNQIDHGDPGRHGASSATQIDAVVTARRG